MLSFELNFKSFEKK